MIKTTIDQVLPVVIKPLERHVASLTYLKYLCPHGLLQRNKLLIDLAISERQSCFESFTNNWLKGTDDSKLIGTVLLDLGKVFEILH